MIEATHRLCFRCEKVRSLKFFPAGGRNRGRICRLCASRSMAKRTRKCLHPSIIKDKPGLTCTSCGARWLASLVHIGGRTFHGFTQGE